MVSRFACGTRISGPLPIYQSDRNEDDTYERNDRRSRSTNGPPKSISRRGQEAETGRHHEKAVEFYERALNENPDHEQAAFRLAVLYDRRAEDAKAIELYERICTAPPVHLNALMNLAVLYEDNNHYDEAHRCLDAVLRTNPNHERARLYMKDVESARSQYYDEDDDRRGDRRNAVLDIPITDFELSVRSRNCLKKMNIRSRSAICSRPREQELLSYKNFGETSLNEIKALLAAEGPAPRPGRGRRAVAGAPAPAPPRSPPRSPATSRRRCWARASPTWSCPSAAARRCSG